MDTWLDKMDRLRREILAESSSPSPSLPPPISPLFFRNILLANLPQRWHR